MRETQQSIVLRRLSLPLFVASALWLCAAASGDSSMDASSGAGGRGSAEETSASGDESGSEPVSECLSLFAELRTCGVATEGEVNCDRVDEREKCEGRCLAALDCDAMVALACEGPKPADYADCEASCAELDFECLDGARVGACDGFTDCDAGEDEQNCPTFACANGAAISASSRCDGTPDCGDESDENGCELFTCASGQSVVASRRCDFTPDCDDESDEENCARIRCPVL